MRSRRDSFHDLRQIPAIDPEYIQFGCAEWFWEAQVNSYALQVEPMRHMTKVGKGPGWLLRLLISAV